VNVLDMTLGIQQSRINRAKRLARHANRVHEIGVFHSQSSILLSPAIGDAGDLNRMISDRYHHGLKANRAFSLAARLYRSAENTLLGVV
jgi:hypothetical protein